MKMIKVSIMTMSCMFLCSCVGLPSKLKEYKRSLENREKPRTERDYSRDSTEMAKDEHMKFKGVPIDGTLDLFVERMQRKANFEQVSESGGMRILKGDFADYKDCTVFVETLDGKDLVSKISVLLPNRDNWELLYGDYKWMKKMLIEKYGKPSSSIEKFQVSYGLVPQDDNDKMHHVIMDKCKYNTIFETERGSIDLRIWYSEGSSVMLTYKDRINGNVIKEHVIDDL